jgi:hypothetical protein
MAGKPIVFTEHAELKFAVLTRHGLTIDRNAVIDTVERPERIDPGYRGRMIAQRILDENRVLRVVFEEDASELRVITFYPSRRARYANKL